METKETNYKQNIELYLLSEGRYIKRTMATVIYDYLTGKKEVV